MLCRAMSCRSPISCWPASAGSCRLGLRGRCLIPRLVAHRVLAVLLGDEHQLIGGPHERVHRLGRHEVGGNADTGGEAPTAPPPPAPDGPSPPPDREPGPRGPPPPQPPNQIGPPHPPPAAPGAPPRPARPPP